MKGLSSDILDRAEFGQPGDGLLNDRRFAFLFAGAEGGEPFKAGSWLHKQHFLSAFSRTALVTAWKTAFDDATHTLTVRARRTGQPTATAPTLLTACLSEDDGIAAAEAFFSEACDEPVELVDGAATKHQFGNTRSGLDASGDLRTIHIVNANTVRALSDAAGVALDPRRFRPNLVLHGSLPPFEEFRWVGGALKVGDDVTMRVIKRTIRCDAVTLWGPGTAEAGVSGGDCGASVDVPALLKQHFPEHGPYLGVYAQVETPGTVYAGDAVVPLQVPAAAAPQGGWVWRLLRGLLLAMVAAYALVVFFPAM